MTRTTHDSAQPGITPLQQRSIEIEVAAAFLAVLQQRLDKEAAAAVFDEVVRSLAQAAAERFRDQYPNPTLSDLWAVWGVLGGDGRLDLTLEELTDTTLRFRVDGCAYAEMYRAKGLERAGVAFSCRRDAAFARRFLPGVKVEQSTTILEGGEHCAFTYTLEER